MTSVELSSAAYRKIVLHAAKYPSQPCAGLLVGSKNAVEDAVPLTHLLPVLGPAGEAGIDLTITRAKERGVDIIGLYEAPVAQDTTEISNLGTAVAEALDGHVTGKPLALVAVGKNLLGKDHGLAGAKVTVSGYNDALVADIRADISAGRFVDDWDDHLADPRVDWWAYGFYTAARVLHAFDPAHGTGENGVEVHMYEQLPAPFGLVRYGVAPDHPDVRNSEHRFDQIARDPRFRFFGNVAVCDGAPSASTQPHVSLSDLSSRYTHLLFAYGASEARALGVPGSDGSLKNVFSALDFVEWYNGHPRAHAPGGVAETIANLNGEDLRHVTVVGAGNVAIDVARVLLRATSHAPRDALAQTDMPQIVLDTLRRWQVEHVDVVARRGPANAAFTNKELREMLALPHAPMKPIPAALLADAMDALPEDAGSRRAHKRLLAQLEKGSVRPWSTEVRPRWALEFFRSPSAILGDTGTVQRVRWDVTKLESGRAVPTGEQVDTPADMVVASVGYEAQPLPGEAGTMTFDTKKHVVPNERGRVVGAHGPVPGMYAAGWAATGPIGIIASTMVGAFAVADEIVHDWKSGAPTLSGSRDADETLAPGLDHPHVVSYDDWLAIDAVERERGAKLNKPREKFIHVHDMLAVLGRE
ncbi:adrenodoxin-NADP(+) reductase [Malassezia cuniculi]|uniref:Adrenodoxin-NADP(+) reductase n=1 Tax=Malassezia cuniculi TaxID=948313 RepID=A0AAF0EWU2_9BASI|nr:adrenodoxin-NADP(+) reductase [Malassezia cuniculi]